MNRISTEEILLNFELGQSNSEFSLKSTDNGIVIRKRSPQNHRMKLQYNKHLLALNLRMDPILVPKIFSSFEDFSYEMEIIHGVPLGVALNSLNLVDMKNISNLFLCYFENIFSRSKNSTQIDQKLLFKIQNMKKFYAESNNDICERAWEILLKNHNQISIPEGWNHGDFSYENILVTNSNNQKKLYAVDFLDSPFESPLIDLGRFWLDLNFGWWGTNFSPSPTWSINNLIIKNDLISLLNEFDISEQALSYFTLFSSLRILPYTKSPVRIAYLKYAIDNLVKENSKWQF